MKNFIQKKENDFQIFFLYKTIITSVIYTLKNKISI